MPKLRFQILEAKDMNNLVHYLLGLPLPITILTKRLARKAPTISANRYKAINFLVMCFGQVCESSKELLVVLEIDNLQHGNPMLKRIDELVPL